jgi:hypothetical protein
VNKTTVLVGVAEVLGAVTLVVTTFTVPAVVDTALPWRVLAVFMALEGGNRLYGAANARAVDREVTDRRGRDRRHDIGRLPAYRTTG